MTGVKQNPEQGAYGYNKQLVDHSIIFKNKQLDTKQMERRKKIPQGVEFDPSPKINPSYRTSLKKDVRGAHMHEARHMFGDKWGRVHTCANTNRSDHSIYMIQLRV